MKAIYNSVAFTTATGLAVSPNANVEVRRSVDNAIATIYEDAEGTTPLSNPFQADEHGRFRFYADGIEGGYSVRVFDGAGLDHTEHNQAVGNAAQRDVSEFGEALLVALDVAAGGRVMKSPRLLFSYSGDNVPNVSAVEEVGLSYTLPANTSLQNGDRIKIKAWGFSAAVSPVIARIRVGGLAGVEMIGIFTFDGEITDLVFRVELVRKADDSQKYEVEVFSTGQTVLAFINFGGTQTIDATVDQDIVATSECAAADQFTWVGTEVEFWPAP